MPNPINGSYQVPGDLGQRLKGTENAVAQLQRLMMKPKSEKPAAAGTMQGFTRARPGSTVDSTGGIDFIGWTFDSAVDLSPAPKPALTDEGGTSFGVVAAGWYSTHVRAQIHLVSGTPTAVIVQANNGFSSTDKSSYYAEAWALNLIDGTYRTEFWVGPFWLGAGDMALGVRVGIPGSYTLGTVSAFVDVWRVG